jgi:hypothetical protein
MNAESPDRLNEIINGLERRIRFALGQHWDRVAEWENNARQTLRWLEAARKRKPT